MSVNRRETVCNNIAAHVDHAREVGSQRVYTGNNQYTNNGIVGFIIFISKQSASLV
jgi:hypothetical protein